MGVRWRQMVLAEDSGPGEVRHPRGAGIGPRLPRTSWMNWKRRFPRVTIRIFMFEKSSPELQNWMKLEYRWGLLLNYYEFNGVRTIYPKSSYPPYHFQNGYLAYYIKKNGPWKLIWNYHNQIWGYLVHISTFKHPDNFWSNYWTKRKITLGIRALGKFELGKLSRYRF